MLRIWTQSLGLHYTLVQYFWTCLDLTTVHRAKVGTWPRVQIKSTKIQCGLIQSRYEEVRGRKPLSPLVTTMSLFGDDVCIEEYANYGQSNLHSCPPSLQVLPVGLVCDAASVTCAAETDVVCETIWRRWSDLKRDTLVQYLAACKVDGLLVACRLIIKSRCRQNITFDVGTWYTLTATMFTTLLFALSVRPSVRPSVCLSVFARTVDHIFWYKINEMCVCKLG